MYIIWEKKKRSSCSCCCGGCTDGSGGISLVLTLWGGCGDGA